MFPTVTFHKNPVTARLVPVSMEANITRIADAGMTFATACGARTGSNVKPKHPDNTSDISTQH